MLCSAVTVAAGGGLDTLWPVIQHTPVDLWPGSVDTSSVGEYSRMPGETVCTLHGEICAVGL